MDRTFKKGREEEGERVTERREGEWKEVEKRNDQI